MRLGQLKRLLSLWVKAELISNEQSIKITEYMKVQKHQQMLKLLKVLFVMGAFWLVVGFIATVRLIDARVLIAVWNFICGIFTPIVNWAKMVAGERYVNFLSGFGCVFIWGLCHYLGRRLQERSAIEINRLGLWAHPELRLGTTALTCGYIVASIGFQLFNSLLEPLHRNYSVRPDIVIPYFSFLAVVFFLTVAYRLKDQIALLFGIAFLGHAVGFFTAYCFACYMIGVQLPAIQLLVGVLLMFIGLWHVEKIREKEGHYFFLFGRTYQWTGLLFIYLSLWVMSLWGFSQDGWKEPSAIELWIANLLYLGASLGAMFYGAFKEDRLYFNFGLTFFIIDTYTLFFSRVWSTFGSAVGSLLLGVLLVATAYALRKMLLKRSNL